MLVVETVARIRREYFVHRKSIKEIVRTVKVSRNTVRKVIRSGASAFSYDRSSQPRPKIDPWRLELDEILSGNTLSVLSFYRHLVGDNAAIVAVFHVNRVSRRSTRQ